MATLAELQTVYGVEDAYNLFDIAMIDVYNDELARQE